MTDKQRGGQVGRQADEHTQTNCRTVFKQAMTGVDDSEQTGRQRDSHRIDRDIDGK